MPTYPRDTTEVSIEDPNPAQDKLPPRCPRRTRTQARQANIPTMDISPSYPTGYANVNVTPGYVGSLKITDEDLMEHILGVALVLELTPSKSTLTDPDTFRSGRRPYENAG